MEETNIPRSKLVDMLLWILVVTLVIIGLFVNHHFDELSWALRFAGWIILICVLVGLVAITTQGKRLWRFTKESRTELYKVVWPTREETVKITMIIAALVLVASMILWGIDSILLKIVGWLMGR